MRTAILACAMLALLLSCTGNNGVIRVDQVLTGNDKRICIIENPRVRSEFLHAYQQALQDRGYAVNVVPAGSPLGVCPLSSKYVAYWSWDLVPYMSQAQIDVYRAGKPAGRAIFQANGHHSDMEERVQVLVRDLYKQ